MSDRTLHTPRHERKGKVGWGNKNPFWKGGRTVTPHGYVLIRVGVDHPLADCRGYAYEHRLVASAMLGRTIKPHEQVHHLDGNRRNNSPDNLEVMQSIAHHRVRHRRHSNRRLPGELNPQINCACGCGATFQKYDGTGRPRRFISGHNNGGRR